MTFPRPPNAGLIPGGQPDLAGWRDGIFLGELGVVMEFRETWTDHSGRWEQ